MSCNCRNRCCPPDTNPEFASLTVSGLTTLECLEADSPTLVVDCTNHRVGVGTATPSVGLTVKDGVLFDYTASNLSLLVSQGKQTISSTPPLPRISITGETELTTAITGNNFGLVALSNTVDFRANTGGSQVSSMEIKNTFGTSVGSISANNIYQLHIQPTHDGSTLSIVAHAGIRVSDIVTAGTPVQDAYGIYIDEINSGSVSNFSLFSVGAVLLGKYTGMASAAVTPPNPPISGNQMNVYLRNGKFIIQWNDSGTVRYYYLDLTSTLGLWAHTTVAP